MSLPDLKGQALYNFIGGRRRYNASRKYKAIDRRYRILFFWAENPHFNKADLARKFGVSRSTITRDIQKLKSHYSDKSSNLCPMCKGRGYFLNVNLAETIEWLSESTRYLNRL